MEFMLAKNWQPGMNIKGWWVSEKLDGIRAYWDGSHLLSRQGNVFVAPEWVKKIFPPFDLDGELWTGREEFSRVSSIVRKKEPVNAEWKDIIYMVFDVPCVEGGFEKRLEKLHDWLSTKKNVPIRVVEQLYCRDEVHLETKLERIEKEQGEGLMLRKPGSLYESGRSSSLLKVKSFQDDEGTIIDIIPGKGRLEGKMGALSILTDGGKEFNLGIGFTDDERESSFLKGERIRFKYQGVTSDGLPRFPRYFR